MDPQVWKDLIGITRSEMKLQQLGLHFRARSADVRDSDVSGDSMMVSDKEHPRVTELTQLPKLNRLTLLLWHPLFTAHGHDVCYFAYSALQFAALAKVLRGGLLCNGQMLSSKNMSAQLMRDPELVADDFEDWDSDTRHDPTCNYFLSMQTDDDDAEICLLPQHNSKSASSENGTDQANSSGVDIFEPLGGSASLDHSKPG